MLPMMTIINRDNVLLKTNIKHLLFYYKISCILVIVCVV